MRLRNNLFFIQAVYIEIPVVLIFLNFDLGKSELVQNISNLFGIEHFVRSYDIKLQKYSLPFHNIIQKSLSVKTESTFFTISFDYLTCWFNPV